MMKKTKYGYISPVELKVDSDLDHYLRRNKIKSVKHEIKLYLKGNLGRHESIILIKQLKNEI